MLSSSPASAAGAIGFPGGVPIFPSTDNLESTSIKVVVGSWRRLNPATSTSSDFTVDVSTYAPKTPFVTRVQLVDVDIPNTQQFIEAAWSRLYYQQGIPLALNCRSLDISVGGSATSIVLPLPIDAITRCAATETDGVTRVFTRHRAPWPIATMSETWKQFSGTSHHSNQYYGLRIFGLQSFESGFLLTRENTKASDAGTLAFDVVSYDFAEALRLSQPEASLYLCASAIPGPTFLAAILTKVIPAALRLAPGFADADFDLQFQFQYSTVEDRFSVYTRFPRYVEDLEIGGQLAEYMGFGTPIALEVNPHFAVKTVAQKTRFHPKDAYACLSSESPRTECEIARNLQTALNTYTWPEFTFNLGFPGEPAIEVHVPGGRMTLRQLAETVHGIVFPLCGVAVTFTTTESGDRSGLRFEHPTRVYAVDFSDTAPCGFKPARIGYEKRLFAASRVHFPIRAAVHIPLLVDCLPPVCDTYVSYNEETQHVLLQSVPFSSFTADIRSTAVPNVFRVDTASTTSFKHGLQVAARLVVVDTLSHTQYPGIVVSVLGLTEFEVLFWWDGLHGFVDGRAVTVVPQDRLPLDLYLQPLSTREKAIAPQMIGFQPLTYEAWADLLSPGTLDLRQDPYILLCLSFQAEDASAQCGNVYFPFENTSQLIFAKILKSSCLYKADYDRGFFHEFRGAGIHLGYIRVRVLNSDGTLYESHGHPASVCLKFDIKQSVMTLGGPGSVLQMPPPDARPVVATFPSQSRK